MSRSCPLSLVLVLLLSPGCGGELPPEQGRGAARVPSGAGGKADSPYSGVSSGFTLRSWTQTGSDGCSYRVHRASMLLTDLSLDVAVVGWKSRRTVRQHAGDHAWYRPLAALNGGYFVFGGGPVSYAKGHLGYESPSGNVKGPRACFAWNRWTSAARLEQSMGRAAGPGTGLFPGDTDVLCAGPQLIADGRDVFWQQYSRENFGSSGISPWSSLPRSALCLRKDRTLLLVAVQPTGWGWCGVSLPEMTRLLLAEGCQHAMNLDGAGSTAFWSAGPPVSYDPGPEDRAVYQAIMIHRP